MVTFLLDKSKNKILFLKIAYGKTVEEGLDQPTSTDWELGNALTHFLLSAQPALGG